MRGFAGRKIRKKGLYQEAVAKELGISRQAVSKWETDLAQPDLDNLKKICEILDISADELLDISCTKSQEKEICNCEIYLINSYEKGAIICAFCAVIFLLLAYFITVFKPELRVGEKGEILSFLEPYFWIESRLWPLLTISLLNAVCCVFLYGKFLKDKEEKR